MSTTHALTPQNRATLLAHLHQALFPVHATLATPPTGTTPQSTLTIPYTATSSPGPSQTQTIASDTITRSVTGDIISGTENGTTKAYTYDKAGRLLTASLGSTTYSYNYSAPTPTQCSQPSANLQSHKNSNRTSSTVASPNVNGGTPLTTSYCYNNADQLISTTDTAIGSPVYDSRGNTIALGTTNPTPLGFAYDSSDRNTAITQWDATGTGKATYYNRDVQGRIVYRETDTVTNWNWTPTNKTHYGFTGSGDTPDFTRDANWNITEKYLQLPGNVLLTLRPTDPDSNKQKTYSLPNIHGDIFATTNTTGTLQSTHMTGPFGEPLTPAATGGGMGAGTAPNNTTPGTSFNYVGQHEKITETDFSVDLTQMGSRIYLPAIGRFLQNDPVEGGGDNSYSYPVDPVNDYDLDGNVWGSGSLKSAWRTAKKAGSWAYNSSEKVDQWVWRNKAEVGISFVPYVGWASKARYVPKIAQGARYLGGVKSPLFGNPTLKTATGQHASRSGLLNKKWMPVRTGWSVNGSAKGGAKPVFRTSIGYGKKAWHINWKHGRFN